MYFLVGICTTIVVFFAYNNLLKDNQSTPPQPPIEKNKLNQSLDKTDPEIANDTFVDNNTKHRLKNRIKGNEASKGNHRVYQEPEVEGVLASLSEERAMSYNFEYNSKNTITQIKGSNHNSQIENSAYEDSMTRVKQALSEGDYIKAKMAMPDNIKNKDISYKLSTDFYTENRKSFHILSKKIITDKEKEIETDVKKSELMYFLALNPSELQKILALGSVTE
jgi:hypothetical protein